MNKGLFYKERQKFFEAVKATKNGENPVITYNKQRFRLFYVNPNDFSTYVMSTKLGYYVYFDKKRKFNVVKEWWYSNRHGLVSEASMYNIKRKHVLCFAELLNQ